MSIKWMPLEAALTWIATRDAANTASVINQIRAKFKDQFEAMRKEQPKSGKELAVVIWPSLWLGPQQQERSWARLKSAIATGNVQAKGFSSNQYLGPILPWERHSDGEPVTSPERLALVIENDRLILRDEAYPLVSTREWNSVILQQDDLMRVFPVRGDTRSPGLPFGKGRKQKSVVEALNDLAGPDRILPAAWSEQDRMDAVDAWLKRHGCEAVSEPTHKRGYSVFLAQSKRA